MKGKTKRIVSEMTVVCLLIAGLGVFVPVVMANPPDDMDLEYTVDNQTLAVTITHATLDPDGHYIYLVEVAQNGDLVLSEEYESQPANVFTYWYVVPAEGGDVLTVTAYCSLYGSMTRSLTVPGGEDDEAPVVDIVNPRQGYLHFSGLPLLPNPFSFIADTMSPGGFRLGPVAVAVTDNFNQPEELDVDIYIDGEKRGDAAWDSQSQQHEWKWTGWGLGTYTLEARAEDTSGNVGTAEMTVWYFCFIP